MNLEVPRRGAASLPCPLCTPSPFLEQRLPVVLRVSHACRTRANATPGAEERQRTGSEAVAGVLLQNGEVARASLATPRLASPRRVLRVPSDGR